MTSEAELGGKKSAVSAAMEQLAGAEEDSHYETVVQHSSPIRRCVSSEREQGHLRRHPAGGHVGTDRAPAVAQQRARVAGLAAGMHARAGLAPPPPPPLAAWRRRRFGYGVPSRPLPRTPPPLLRPGSSPGGCPGGSPAWA